jgi:hypothetical protein
MHRRHIADDRSAARSSALADGTTRYIRGEDLEISKLERELSEELRGSGAASEYELSRARLVSKFAERCDAFRRCCGQTAVIITKTRHEEKLGRRAKDAERST